MFQLSRLFKTEYRHFQKLSPDAQKLFFSSAIYALANPLLFVFTNAFILRQTNSFFLVGIYNLGYFITLPLTFLLNGALLKHIQMKHLFLIGLLGQGLVVTLIFFWHQPIITSLLLLGGLQGVPLGLYWANRNFITVAVTHDQERTYYCSLETILNSIASIIVPITFGWFIVFGGYSRLYSAQSAYQILIIIVLCLLFLAGYLFQSTTLSNPIITQLLITHPDKAWWYSRISEFFRGFMDRTVEFFPPLLVFNFLGKEGVLGTAQSAMAVFGMIVIYLIGRKTQTHHRLLVLGTAAGIFAVASLLFAVNFTAWSALVLILILGLVDQLTWVTHNPIQQKAVDLADGGDTQHNYAYITDREAFLNIGRVIAMFSFFYLITLSQTTALRFTPLVVAISQVALWLFTALLVKELKKNGKN